MNLPTANASMDAESADGASVVRLRRHTTTPLCASAFASLPAAASMLSERPANTVC